jgi:hypothetical protein
MTMFKEEGAMLYLQGDGAWLETRGKMVAVGDRAIPRKLAYRQPGGDGMPALEVRIELIDGGPVVTSIQFSAAPGTSGVRVNDLKTLAAQFEGLVEDICATAAWVRNASGAFRDFPISAESRQAAMPSIRRARKVTRRKINKEFLTRVADTYRAAGRAPTKAVAAAFAVDHRTAGRYIAEARKERLLPPTTRGKGNVDG